jgi:hypothetical protein
MSLTLLLADAARPRLTPGELLWAALPLIGILLVGALILYVFDRWRKRRSAVEGDVCDPNDQLSHFRSLYERGEMSREEFESVKVLLAGQLRKEMNVPDRGGDGELVVLEEEDASPPDPPAPLVDTNVQATPPGPQSPPPAEGPQS